MATAVPIPLVPGTYTITSVSANLVVSRSYIEDASLAPKRISLVAAGTPYSPWKVTQNRDGTYTLTNVGAPAVEINSKLYAELAPISPARETRWRVTNVPIHGANQYIIESADWSTGWRIPNNAAGTQVDVKPLVVLESFPPQYPAYERFIFKKVP